MNVGCREDAVGLVLDPGDVVFDCGKLAHSFCERGLLINVNVWIVLERAHLTEI